MKETSQLETGSSSLIEMGSHQEPKSKPIMAVSLPRVSLQFKIDDPGNPRNWPMRMKVIVPLFTLYTAFLGQETLQ